MCSAYQSRVDLATILRQTSRHIRVIQSYWALGTTNVNGYTFMRRVYYPRILQRFHCSELRGLPSASSSSMYTDSDEQHTDFFHCTTGRWLWDEEEQLEERYKAFNIQELQRVAARSVEANACLGIKKCGEGSYNKVFRLTMDNGMAVIARVPNPNAGPAGFTTASEVATMDFVSNLVSPRGLPLLMASADVGYRLELYSKFLYQKSLLGIPEQTIQWAQNIL